MTENPKWIVRKTYEVEQSDLVLNWSIVECPECDGGGEVFRFTGPDTDEQVWEQCDNCGGTGELAINDPNFHDDDDPQ